MESIGDRIRFARKLRGLTQQQIAAHFKINRVSVAQWETRGNSPDPDRLPELARLLGTTTDWLLSAKGRAPAKDGKPELVYAPLPEDEPQPEFDPDWSDEGAVALLDGRLAFSRRLPGGQPEIAAKPGLGMGQIDDARDARIQSQGIATGHPVTGEWVIPVNYLRSGLDAKPSEVVIMPVIGHSMLPLLAPNDRVLVDISQNEWVGDAVYVIDDGSTVFQAKTLKKVTSSHPPRFRIISEADKADEVIRDVTQFRIVGRVVGRVSRM